MSSVTVEFGNKGNETYVVTESSINHCLTFGLPVSSVTVEFGNKGNETYVVTESSINHCLTLGQPV